MTFQTAGAVVLESRAQEAAALAETLSFVPVKTDGTKTPLAGYNWKRNQEERASPAQVATWVRAGHGLAVLGGQVSGNLEIIDCDHEEVIAPFVAGVEEAAPGLMERLCWQETPRPAMHFLYRLPEPPAGNTDLAHHQVGLKEDPRSGAMVPDVRALIQTRGEGGYVVCYLSPPEVHETGRPYQILHGSFADIPRITMEEREVLWSVARSLTQVVPPDRQLRARPKRPEEGDDERPGDAFNRQADWHELLTEMGGKLVHTGAGPFGRVEYWRRPGKDKGHSATLYAVGPNDLYVWTSSWYPLVAGHQYDPFGFICATRYGGDFGTASRALRDQGFGSPRRVRVTERPPEPIDPYHPPPSWNGEPAASGEPMANGAAPTEENRWKIKRWAQLQHEPDPVWHWQQRLEEASLACLFGLSGSAKSFTAVEGTMGTVTGRGLFAGQIGLGNALYINIDGGKGFKKRIAAWKEVYGSEETADFIIQEEPVNFFDHKSVIPWVKHAVKERWEPRLVVLDTLANMIVGADEISTRDMGQVVEGLRYAQRELNALFWILHHATKDGTSMRGVASLYNACTTVMRTTKDRSILTLACEKQRNDEDFPTMTFKLRRIAGSCILEAHESKVLESSERAAESQEGVLHLIAEAERAALALHDETLRADTDFLKDRFPQAPSTVAAHVKNLVLGGKVFQWNRPDEGRSKHYVFGVLCQKEGDHLRLRPERAEPEIPMEYQ